MPVIHKNTKPAAANLIRQSSVEWRLSFPDDRGSAPAGFPFQLFAAWSTHTDHAGGWVSM